ncbi:MAG TPA: hypothetical protein VFH48_42640 [Chloroflexota bacterium]|nr:hypothetical protein [Chloroflexota bacterium]
MKRVPVDEFARHAAEYLEGSEIVSVEKDGEVIGQYVPVPNGHTSNGTGPQATSRRYGDLSEAELLRELEKGISPEDLARIRKIDEKMKAIYDKAGMTEEEFAAYFDMTKPTPGAGMAFASPAPGIQSNAYATRYCSRNS